MRVLAISAELDSNMHGDCQYVRLVARSGFLVNNSALYLSTHAGHRCQLQWWRKVTLDYENFEKMRRAV